MEEDLKILEKLRRELGLYANGDKIKQGQALEHLIKSYKELEEENKELKKLYKSEKKMICDENCKYCVKQYFEKKVK